MKRFLSFIITLTCYSIGLSAHSEKLFTGDRDLSSSFVNQVFQDTKGYIWIGTEDGLNFYDGNKFLVYKHKKDDPFSIKNNNVTHIYANRRGDLFIGYTNGVQRYDYVTDKFENVPLVRENRELNDARIFSIIERKNGDIVIGTSGYGIFLLRKGAKKAYYNPTFRLPVEYITAVAEDLKQNLWIGTEGGGVFRISPDKRIKHYEFKQIKGVLDLTTLCIDSHNRIYIGSLNRGMFDYNAAKDCFEEIPHSENIPIQSMNLDNSQKILLGTRGCGMKIFDPVTRTISNSNYQFNTFDFSKSQINSLIKDNNGNLWIALYQKGVVVLPNEGLNFGYIGNKSIMNNYIGSSNVSCLCKDSEGILWLGVNEEGIYALDKNHKFKAHFCPDKGMNVPKTVTCIFQDSNKDMWIGSFFKNLAKLNIQTGNCDFNQTSYINNVVDMCEDGNKNLWIATMGSGLACWNLKEKKMTYYSNEVVTSKNHGNVVPSLWISCLCFSHDNKLYIGSYSGLGCLDLKSKSFISTFHKRRILSDHIILTIFENSKGFIWIGTTEGLFRLNPKNGAITFWGINNGLPSEMICGIQEDKKGNLWISTNHGLSYYNIKKNVFTNFFSYDGLQSNEFSKKASIRDKSGNMIFAGLNGITYFAPDEISLNKKRLQIKIVGLRIKGKYIHQGDKSGPFDIVKGEISEANLFHVAAKDNSFIIQLSAMELYNPERITFIYNLDGNNWIETQPGANWVPLTLQPGTYHLKVKAKDGNNYSPEKEITIIVSPPWYLSFIAKFIYLAIIVTIVYFIIKQLEDRRRMKEELMEREHAEELNEAKLQFFINIAHEIRTPMTLIYSPLQELMKKDKDNVCQKLYRTIDRNSQRILSLVNQLMDVRKIDKGQMVLKFKETDIISFIQSHADIFMSQAQKKNIQYTFNHEMHTLNAWIDPENFDKIILNLLSNAFKYTPEKGKINITVKVTGQKYVIIVSDNGITIQPEEMERIFERFYQSNNQMNMKVGTGIGLHLAKSLVELHHGKIWVENEEDGNGCRFIVQLPLGNGHLRPEEMSTETEEQTTESVTKEQSLAPQNDEEGDTQENTIKTKTKYRVMIVEDDDEIKNYLHEELGHDYHIIEAENGKEALSFILKKTPDLVISDIMMPEMDGITLCRKIKQNILISHVPVILLTAKTTQEDNIEGLEVGADSYLTKPFSIRIVKETIRNLIRNRESLKNTKKGEVIQKEMVNKVEIKTPDEKLMERILTEINKNISNPDYDIETMAANVGISRVHLYRKLKELTGQSTREFIRNTRLQQAASLLKEKGQNISEVAMATGFINVTYFSTAFKTLYGLSPKDFINKYRKENV